MTIVYRSDGAAISNEVMDDNFEQLANRYQGADTASSATITPVVGYNYYTISGTTDITSIVDVSIGARIYLKFNVAGGAIGHTTQILMPGTTTITWRAGDVAIFVNSATGVWRCINYMRGDIAPDEAITQTAGDNSTLACSTAYADNLTLTSPLLWTKHAVFTAAGSTTLGETTTIPSTTEAIRLNWTGVGQTLGTASTDFGMYIQMSDSATYPTSVWYGQSHMLEDQPSVLYTNGFFPNLPTQVSDAEEFYGTTDFWKLTGNTWIADTTCCHYGGAKKSYLGAGKCTLTGTLDRLKITSGVTATDPFDFGSVEIWVLS